MNIEELKYQILQQFGFPPTPEQAQALDVFVQFMTDSNPHAVMILRGSAGTGKTSLSGAIVRTLRAVRQKVMLLAPTGRAAKVFSLNSGMPAYTIHRRIYREKAFAGVDGQFNLNDNLYTDTLFMVDEASMIANMGLGGMSFGSGCLLDDLVHFVYQGRNDRLLLIGDKAQLPPVGEEESPALHAAMLEGYGLKVYECDLNEVLRQSEESGILYNATMIRQMITHDDITQLPKIHFAGYSDIKPMPGVELIEALADSYHHVGLDDTIVVTRSNKRANIFNQGIRNMVLDREEELSQGDILMIVKNNYYWMEEERKKIKERQLSEERRVKSEEFSSSSDDASEGSEEQENSSLFTHHSSLYKEQFVGESFGRINKAEAELTLLTLAEYFTKIGKQRVLSESIDVGIISPYRAQVQYLKKLIKKYEFFKPYRRLISVNTVDGFQGQERDVILISLVRSNDEGQIGFLKDLRRMNVAMTRARMKLIILGNKDTMTKHPFYKKLWEYVEGLNNDE